MIKAGVSDGWKTMQDMQKRAEVAQKRARSRKTLGVLGDRSA